MRLVASLFLLTLLAPTLWAQVELVRVWPGYRSAESFVGIGEYFGRPEDTGGRIIRRSQPAERGGYYWLIRLRTPQAQEAEVQIEVVRPGRTEPERHRLAAPLPAGRPVLLVGLTGADWPDAEERPLAWRIQILDSQGRPLAGEQSFLWSRPDAAAPRE